MFATSGLRHRDQGNANFPKGTPKQSAQMLTLFSRTKAKTSSELVLALFAQHDWTLFIQFFRGNLHEVSDQTSAILIIRIVPDMLWFGLFIHAGPDGSARFRVELSCVPVVAMVDTDGAAFTDAG